MRAHLQTPRSRSAHIYEQCFIEYKPQMIKIEAQFSCINRVFCLHYLYLYLYLI